ncbi:hypothetical protein MMC16_005118 [Acarospora aff. strigata]|nr:hypothetical protein [Acarospora aff. strigata]
MAACHFLRLPRELRDQIYGEIFFPGEDEPKDLEQDNLGLAATAVRQIRPYETDERHKPSFGLFDLAIIRTSRQIQIEAETVFYSTSSFNLMYRDWDDDAKMSYEFLETLPRRNRGLIRRIERKCYSEAYSGTISLCDWQLFMEFLARECRSLQSLKLWGPGDPWEGPRWVDSCQRDSDWVQAILQVRGLSYFDIPVIKGGVIYNYRAFREDFLPWLKSSLLERSPVFHESASHSQRIPSPVFPFRKLPSSIRRQVYQRLLLPANRRLHPYLKPWYDQTTRNFIPLLQTCRSIHDEAETVLYKQAVFTSLFWKYDLGLLQFFASLPVRLRCCIRSVRVLYEHGNKDMPVFQLIKYMIEAMQVEELVLVLPALQVSSLNANCRENAEEGPTTGWNHQYLRGFARIGRFKRFSVEASDESSVLDPSCRAWLEAGLPVEPENPSWPTSGSLIDADDTLSVDSEQMGSSSSEDI